MRHTRPYVTSTLGGGVSNAPSSGGGGSVAADGLSAAEYGRPSGGRSTTAEAIITHREQNGPFATVDDLLDVRGIGEAKLEQLRGLVTV